MKTSKMSEVDRARRAKRVLLLNRVQDAIRAGHAHLNTCFGRYNVLSYNDATGNAVTLPDGKTDSWGRRTFMVCLEDILI